MKEEQFIEDKEMRNKCVNHYEVLEKVKQLLLIPGTDVATTKQVAEFYKVSVETIKGTVFDNREEIETDGLKSLTGRETKEFLVSFQKQPTNGKGFFECDGIKFANRSNLLFTRRAILRVGMLLRDSDIAKSVRDQLLNIEEKTDNETKTADINEEQGLLLSIATSYASGNPTAIMISTQKYSAWQKRHIEALKADNGKLVADNKALAEGNLEWSDRSQIVYAMRRLAGESGVKVQKLWGDLYNQLLYKYHMNVRARGKQSWIQHVEEHEWNCVNKVFSSMCNSYGLSASEILEGIKVK